MVVEYRLSKYVIVLLGHLLQASIVEKLSTSYIHIVDRATVAHVCLGNSLVAAPSARLDVDRASDNHLIQIEVLQDRSISYREIFSAIDGSKR